MMRGLYISGLGMTTQMKRMDVISNNIANGDTTGHKKDIVVTSSFPDMLTARLNDPRTTPTVFGAETIGKMSLGVTVDKVHTDFSQGTFKPTADPYSLSISGDGFFVVEATDATGAAVEKYTRDGDFTLSADGYLVTAEGYYVLGTNGRIQLPQGDTAINENGLIVVDNRDVTTLRTVSFTDLQSLRKTENNLYERTDETEEQAATGRVIQGYLEASNISIVNEMVDMITVSRAYEANSKMIMTHDQILQKAVTEIAKK